MKNAKCLLTSAWHIVRMQQLLFTIFHMGEQCFKNRVRLFIHFFLLIFSKYKISYCLRSVKFEKLHTCQCQCSSNITGLLYFHPYFTILKIVIILAKIYLPVAMLYLYLVLAFVPIFVE